MHRYYLIVQLLLGLITILMGCGGEKKTLLFIVDSITTGNAVDPKHTFPVLVDDQLNGYRSICLERPGWTTGTYLEKWEELENDLPSHADLVFIQAGAIDLRIGGYDDSTIANCIENMKAISGRMQKHFPDAEIVLLSDTKIDYSGMDQSMRRSAFSPSTNSYLSRIGAGYSILAADNKYNFIDLHRLVPINSMYDGVHLDKNGHNIVANIIFRFLREIHSLDRSMTNNNQN